MTLRILGGDLKNRLLKTPKGPFSKPTMSLLRKAVFDMCQGKIEGASFLDLFACSGAMGIEALSRGASHATFLEKDRKTCHLLHENIALYHLEAKSTLLCSDVFSQIRKLEGSYDILYIDPPYPLLSDPKNPILSLFQVFEEGNLCNDSAWILLEEGAPGQFLSRIPVFSRIFLKDTRRFGSTLLHRFIFAKQPLTL